MKTNERVVTDPSQHGWVELDDGRWGWVAGGGSGTGGGIQGGDTVGEVTTWDGSEWTPDSSLTIDSSGNAMFSGEARFNIAGGAVRINATDQGATSPYIRFWGNQGGSWYNVGRNTADGNFHINVGANFDSPANDALTIDAKGDATFSGTVDAAGGFTVNGQPISGGSDLGSGFVLENESGPTDNKKFGIGVQESSGALRFQARNDAGGGGGNYFQFDRNGNQVTQLGCYRSGGLVGQWDISSNIITATNFTASSDERLKDNITTAPVGLIDSLKGREWDWSESGEKGSGVVAQELEQVLPHLVHTDDEGMKSVAYNGLIAYLIEEVKALKAEVEALK